LDSDQFRVVEWEKDREIAHLAGQFSLIPAKFVPGTSKVFYSQAAQRDGYKTSYKIWDFESGRIRPCLDSPEGGFEKMVFLDEGHALGSVMRKDRSGSYSGASLAMLFLEECRSITLAHVDASNSKGKIWSQESVSLSPDRRSLAYIVYPGYKAVIWDVTLKRVGKELYPAPLVFQSTLTHTPDGKLIIFTGATHSFGGDKDYKGYLLFYDASSYQLIRRQEHPLPFLDAHSLAVSPDGSILAVGYKTQRRELLSDYDEAHIILFDLVSGQELGRAVHCQVKARRTNPFAAIIRRLTFTPDGKYLISSTDDTRVWQINDSG
jgi:WD40 repeat protein